MALYQNFLLLLLLLFLLFCLLFVVITVISYNNLCIFIDLPVIVFAGYYSHISTLADVHEHVQVKPL